MSRKDTIEYFYRLADEKGGRCLSTEYVNGRKPLRWQCARGHIWEATPSMVKGSQNKPGTWCRKCGIRAAARKRMHNLDDMQRLAEEHGGRCISPEYMSSQVKHRWRCRHGHEFEMTPNAVQNEEWCPKCSGHAKPTLDEINEFVRRKYPSAKCLSTEYINSSMPLKWHCGVEGHPPFESAWKSVKWDGAWCEQCRKDRARPRKYSRKLLVRFAESAGGKLISNETYRDTKQSLRWQCADGHEFKRSLDSILAARSFCPKCTRRTGLREEYIRGLFFYMFDMFFDRSSASDIRWLVNKRGHAMELDGYNAALSLAFEHNGQQHYELDGFYIKQASRLAIRLEDDSEKMRLCRENGVTLIIIPFNVKLDDIQKYVLKELEKAGKTPPNTTYFAPGILAPSILEKLRQHAISLGGQLLSEKYQGSMGKLTWQCKNPKHPPFKAAPSSVLGRGSWCKKCAGEKQSDSYRVSSEQVQEWARAAKGELVTDGKNILLTEKTYALTDRANFHCRACNHYIVRTIRQVKEGRLCLCYTKKTRATREGVENKLAERSMHLKEPVMIQGGRSIVTVECEQCGTAFPVRVRNIINDGFGCPICRRNARITIEKARELGERLGFSLISTEVNGGNDVLHWECKECGERLEKAYREMRNIRRCPVCIRNSAAGRLRVK